MKKPNDRWIMTLIPLSMAIAIWLSNAPRLDRQAARGPARADTRGFPISRVKQEDSDGFYHQPSGLAEDYYTPESRALDKVERDLETVRDSGAKFLRVGMFWDEIEPEPDQYDWAFWDELVEMAPRYGVTLIPYVCGTPKWLNDDSKNYWRKPPLDTEQFARFMYRIARRYKGRIHSWEIWNEPDNDDYWLGTPDQFAELAAEGAKGVKHADERASVVLGGLAMGRSPFAESLLGKHDLGRVFDAIDVHEYFETWSNKRAEEITDYIKSIYDVSRQGGAAPDLWMAGFGYSDHRFAQNKASVPGAHDVDVVHDYEHTEAYQASALWKHHILALSAGRLGLTAWESIDDHPWRRSEIGDGNDSFLGVLDSEGRRKPAFYALKLYNKIFDEPVRLINSQVTFHAPSTGQSVIEVFEKWSGDIVVTGWLRSTDPSEVSDHSGMVEDERRELVSIDLPSGDFADPVTYNLHGDPTDTPDVAVRWSGNTLSRINLSGETPFIAVLFKK